MARVDGVIGDTEAKKYFYHTDYEGSIRAITDQSGKIVFNTDYLAFGTKFASQGDFDELHGFTGKEWDPDVGLYYFNARWYDPDSGRFISEDPAADPNNPNLYSYCGNNPVMRIDPTGQFWEFLLIPLINGIVEGLNEQWNGGGGDFWEGFARGFIFSKFEFSIPTDGGDYGESTSPPVEPPADSEENNKEIRYMLDYDILEIDSRFLLASNSPWIDMQVIEAMKNYNPESNDSGGTIYDRQAAVAYARKWAKGRNSDYDKLKVPYTLWEYPYSVKNHLWYDCTNFVSQVLYAGGIKQTHDWYYNTGFYNEKGSASIHSNSWTVAKDFATWLRKDSNIIDREILISKGFTNNDIAKIANQVEIGDLIGWSEDKNGAVIHHFGVISMIRNGEIYYCGHNNDQKDKLFKMGVFDNSVIIFHIKDKIK